MMMGGADPGWAILMLLTLIIVGLSVAIAVARPAGTADSAGHILDERLARGDISPDEFRAARATLAREHPSRSPAPRRALLVAVIAALIAAMIVGATSVTSANNWPGWMRSMHDQMWGGRRDTGEQAPPPLAGAREIQVVAGEFFFEPTDLRVRSGETVNIAFDNRGAAFHSFRIEDQDWVLEADPGEQDRGAFIAPAEPDPLSIICDVPGHASAGMRATLTVEPSSE